MKEINRGKKHHHKKVIEFRRTFRTLIAGIDLEKNCLASAGIDLWQNCLAPFYN